MAGSVNYQVVDNWGAGFNASVSLTAGAGGLNGWTITFEAAFDITQIWNAEIVGRVGNVYTIRNAAWNGTVPEGQVIQFGFLGGPTSDPVPDAFAVNASLPPPLPILAAMDASVTEGNSGTKYLDFLVTLSAPAAGPVTVGYATANETATAGTDYTAATGTLTFAAGETSKTVRVAVRGDTTAEATETMRLLLSSPSGATIGDGLAIGRIVDDDTRPSIRINDVTVTEGDVGTSNATFTISLSQAFSQSVSVRWATANGTAVATSDYRTASGTVTFAAGETSKTVSVAVVGDFRTEATETFQVRLSSPTNATIADGTGVATILDTDTVPTIGVSDVALAEGNAGQSFATFTVSLNKAWGSAVSVGFTTQDGTAIAGQDYLAQAGTLTFAAGETSKTVTIAVTGDTAVEANETFSLLLRTPSGATIRDNTGLATIVNDDTASGGGGGGGQGFLSTSGNQIVDETGESVRITGVNWFGMESSTFTPHGLWARNWQEMMGDMAAEGFNTIRLPFSLEAFQPGKVANGIDFSKNPDLVGLSPIQILDKIVDKAGELGMRIILDNHRSAAGAGPNGNGQWVDGGYTEQQWIDTWKMLAGRYAGDPTVIGADLANEPHGATWAAWSAAAERAGNAIHSVNDDWLIFVEGVGSFEGSNYWWGGNLKGVATDPVVLNTANKVVYSPHDYGNSVYAQPWFSDPAFPNNLTAKFDEFWGYIYKQEIAPIYLGEFGSRLADPKDTAWLSKLLPYLDGDFDANGTRDIPAGDEGMSWTWWSWNPNSGDTGGILADDWATVIDAKMALLTPQLSDMWVN
ncbi:cellulase family glycosylhydrolase [Roseomonas sp. PWR1]|uniref:cellulase n=1 Tax=Roseomonas nitratireducens TaxID=2820810 RepID=A0ABS4B1H0_9PROT|nr:cellulase family glycosylhydrolase [Neoroseomonas nitratireducens]